MVLLKDKATDTTVVADSAYGSSALRAELIECDMGTVIKPPSLHTVVPHRHSVDDFTIDTQAAKVTCHKWHDCLLILKCQAKGRMLNHHLTQPPPVANTRPPTTTCSAAF